MFDKKNIELDEKRSKPKTNVYLIKDDKGDLQFVYSIYRNPTMGIIFPKFIPALNSGLLPVIEVLNDKKMLFFEPNPAGSTVYEEYFDLFVKDTLFAKEAAAYIVEHFDEL